MDTIYLLLQTTTNNIETWANKTGFNFSPGKSICTIFTKKKAKYIVINLNGTTITNKNTTKMLGVIFDKRQTWSPYIKYLKKLRTDSLKIIKILSHTSWGGESKSLVKIFNAIIQAKINYGAILYRSAANSTLKLIDTRNNSGLRLPIGAFIKPTLCIYNLAGEPPPTLKRTELFIKYIGRLSRLNKGKISDVNDEITKLTNENAATPIKIIHREHNTSPPWDYSYVINTELNALPKQNTTPEIFRSHVYNILDDFKNHQKIYTDASKRNEGVGIAITLENTNITFKLPNVCSIIQLKL